jgi:hypothetical protein
VKILDTPFFLLGVGIVDDGDFSDGLALPHLG